MSLRTALLALLVPLVIAAAGCGGDSRATPPQPGVIGTAGGGDGGGKVRRSAVRGVFDPAPTLLKCLRGKKIPARRTGLQWVTVGDPARGLRVRFLATEGETQTAQLQGRAEGAAVIGRALLYPGTASDRSLPPVEKCTEDAGFRE